MTSIVPTIGRIVYYRLRAHQATEINERRKHGYQNSDYHRWKKNGTMVHSGNNVEPGQIVPMMIVAVWGNTPECAVNGKVFLDGSDDYWVTSVSVGDKDGYYHWMPYQIGQAAKTEEAERKAGV